MSGAVLVTGGTGFLGSHVAETLLARGDRVRLLARRPSAAAWLAARGGEIVGGDLCDPAAVRGAVRGCRTVIHCAGLVSDWGPPDAFEAVNVRGVAHLLDACAASSIDRLVHVSTVDVYGYPDSDGLDESTPVRDRGFPYSATKIAGERLVWRAAAAGLPAVVIRPASIYGPRSVMLGGRLTEAIRAHLPVIEGGRPNAGLAYVGNVVALILRSLDDPAAVGAAFHAVDEDGRTWWDFIVALAKGLGLPVPRLSVPRRMAYTAAWLVESAARASGYRVRPFVTRTAVELLGTSQGFSLARARDRLGFRPSIGFDEGIARTVAWLAASGVAGA